jgi:hypothetical protein
MRSGRVSFIGGGSMQLDLELENRRHALELAHRLYMVHLRAGADETELERRKTEFIRRCFAYDQIAPEPWRYG